MYYSWLPRGCSNSIVNTYWRGRAVVIFAQVSSGEWIAFLGNKTANSWNFIKFIFILSKYWEMWLNLKENEVIVTLDNAAIHRWSTTKRVAALLKTPLHFLQPYSPYLAPTEWIFYMNKRMIAKNKQNYKHNFTFHKWKRFIMDCFNFVDSRKGRRRIWMEFIAYCKKITR